MSERELIAVLESGISLAVIWVLVLKLWPSLRVDEFRQALFAVRDELFDFAASGTISFNHPAYRLLRDSMNGFIRYGHQLTVFRLACNLVRRNILGEHVFSWDGRWEAALKTVTDENVRLALIQFQDRTLVIVIKRLVTGSPILLTLLALTMLVEIAKSQWMNLRELAKTSAVAMVNRLFDPRFLEEEASEA